MADELQGMAQRSDAMKLPIGVTLAEAFRFSWSNRLLFVRFMIIPAALGALLSLGLVALHDSLDSTASRLIWIYLSLIPDFLVLTWFAVACHRLILIGEGAVAKFGLTRWTWRETQFFSWMLLAYALGYLFMMFCIAVLPVVAFFVGKACGFPMKDFHLMIERSVYFWALVVLAVIPFAYVVGRVSLLLPATAIDLQPNLSSAWDLSEGNGWRVAILVGGVPLLSMATQALIWTVPSWLLGETLHETQSELGAASIGLTFLQSILRYIFAAVEIAILSISFRRLRIIKEHRLASPAAI